MNSHGETLGYGTHLIIDGFSADEPPLSSEDAVTAFLLETVDLLEPGKKVQPAVYPVADLPSGVSAALRLAESHAALHTFDEACTLSLWVFTRHGLELGGLTKRLTATFGVRRFESHLGNHSKTMPADPEQRKRSLLGDRSYTATRLSRPLRQA